VKRLRTPDLPADGISGMVARYDAEIAFVDHQLGVLVRNLDKLGLGENTIVAVVADHGEGLLDHGELNPPRSWPCGSCSVASGRRSYLARRPVSS
jgi:arylsulfatase A-like enzyme